MNDLTKGAPWTLRSLTRTRRDSGAVYTREVEVEAQIQQLTRLSERARRQTMLAALPPGHPDRLREETLVFALRECALAGDEETAWQVAERLVERISGHVARQLARWRLPAEDADDCTRDLFAALWEALWDRSPVAEFWEVRFWVCLDRRLWNLVEKRQAALDIQRRPADEAPEAEADEAESLLMRQVDGAPGPDVLTEREEALARLTENERLAVYLRYAEGIPEESDDPERETIARILGVTGRSVRNYLRRAEQKLRDWQRDKS